MAVVGLEMTSYTIAEHHQLLEVCARVFDPDLECPISFPFDMFFTTVDGSAGIIMNIS